MQEGEDADDEALFDAHIREALDRYRLSPSDADARLSDADARLIVREAGLLNPRNPDPRYGPISSIRLFLGIITVGRLAHGAPPLDVDEGLARFALEIGRSSTNGGLLKEWEAQHTQRDLETALRQLGDEPFSHTTMAVLRDAMKDGELRGREIARSLLTWKDGTLYEDWTSVSEYAALLDGPGPSESSSKSLRTVRDEMQALLAKQQIQSTQPVVRLLVDAAAFRGTGALELGHILAATLLGRAPSQTSTDATAMLRAIIATGVALAGATLEDGGPADASNPLRFSLAVESLLARAYSIQSRILRTAALATRGLVSALLTVPIADRDGVQIFQGEGVEGAPVDFDSVLEQFRRTVNDRLASKPDEIRRWDRALDGLEPAPLPKLNNDQPGIGRPRDKLGIERDALAIANAMNARTSADLISDLLAADRIAESPASDGRSAASTETPSVEPGLPPNGGSEDDEPPLEDAASRALELTSQEIVTLISLSPFLGGSPRRARRCVNVYRVAKASSTAAEIKKLEDGDHRALATQLAIATGAPNAFGLWIEACTKADDASIGQRVDELPAADEERRNISGALKAFQGMPDEGKDVVKRLAAQAERASRFSFVVPRKVSPSSGEGRRHDS